MSIQDRDYMKERARLREAESRNSKYKKKPWPEENTKITTLQKTTLIIIGIIITGLLITQIRIATWKKFLEEGAKEDMQQMINLQNHMEQEIKKNLLITIPQLKPSLKSEQTQKNTEKNHLIQPQEPTVQTQQKTNPRNKSQICKILKNGKEECRFMN
jgi:hypothetical protein